MSVDPLAAVGGIQKLAATLQNLGPDLSSAAPTGSFGAVLARLNSEVAALEGASSPAPGGTAPALSNQSFPVPGSSFGSGTGVATAPPSGEQVVTDAEKYLGVPYVWGGTNPSTGLDCSGLVQRVYQDLGVDLPRTSQEQARAGTPVASLADAQPGDLVFFAGSDGTARAPGHVGIYMGNGMMIDAPHAGADVQVQPVGTPVAIRRILPGGLDPSSLPGFPGLSSLAGLSGFSGAPTSPTSPGMDRLGVPAGLQSLFQQAGLRYGVDPLLLASVAKQESGFQTGAVSPAGAVGLMQMMPATAAGLGVNPNDPASAIDGAAQLLAGYLHQYGGSVPKALAAYNAGPAAVAQYGGVPPYAETQNYVAGITSMLDEARGASASAAASAAGGAL